MPERIFMEKAIQAVIQYLKIQNDYSGKEITEDEIYIMWEYKSQKYNKVMMKTALSNNLYFEFTWSFEQNEGTLDCYPK